MSSALWGFSEKPISESGLFLIGQPLNGFKQRTDIIRYDFRKNSSVSTILATLVLLLTVMLSLIPSIAA